MMLEGQINMKNVPCELGRKKLRNTEEYKASEKLDLKGKTDADNLFIGPLREYVGWALLKRFQTLILS